MIGLVAHPLVEALIRLTIRQANNRRIGAYPFFRCTKALILRVDCRAGLAQLPVYFRLAACLDPPDDPERKSQNRRDG